MTIPLLSASAPVSPAIVTLHELAPNYEAFIVDVWGVICDGVQAFPSAIDALRRLRTVGPVALLSNTARRSDALACFLTELGIGADCYDILITAGEACHVTLKAGHWHDADSGRPWALHYIGPDRDRALLLDSGVPESPELKQAGAILCTGMGEALNALTAHEPLLAEGVATHLPFICANPDRVVHIGTTPVPCAGALADRYEELGGRVLRFGKPEPAIYDECLVRLRQLKPSLNPACILAIGDGLETDIAGANRYGIPSVLVGTGVSKLPVEEGAVPTNWETLAIKPAFVAPALQWRGR